MREHLDCAALATPFNEVQASGLQGSYVGGRLVIHLLASGAGGDASRALAEAAMALRRYDVCLLQVCPANLPWARTNLQAARLVLATPVIAITRDLKAAALDDLHTLGVGDFLREPFCAEELRARCERLLARHASLYAKVAAAALAPSANQFGEARGHYGETRADGAGGQPGHALPASALESYAIASAAGSQASLRAAKTQVIERFETAYIKAALHRHRGNIALAARSVQKHRRAFWALMHKYEIDPAPYRALGKSGKAPTVRPPGGLPVPPRG